MILGIITLGSRQFETAHSRRYSPLRIVSLRGPGRERRHCANRSLGVTLRQLSVLRIKTVLTIYPAHPAFPFRAGLVAGAGAALALLALANLSTSAPPSPSVDRTPSVRAPMVAPVARDPLALANSLTR